MNRPNRPESNPHSGPPLSLVAFIAVVTFLTTACQFIATPQGQGSYKLLALDALDSSAPNVDLLSVSLRETSPSISIQVDLLDFTIDDSPTIQILLDTFPGSSGSLGDNFTGVDLWETRLTTFPDLPMLIEGEQPETDSGLINVQYDHVSDIVEINLPRSLFHPPGPFNMAIASFDPEGSLVADTIKVVRSDAPSPEPIPLLLIFDDVFPAATPAQALRSWDGAHNGPAGERFGLRHLLEAVERFQVPVVLADLRQPESMAGLRILEVDPWIRDLENRGLLSLPDSLPLTLCEQASAIGWPDEVLESLKTSSASFGFPPATTMSCFGQAAGNAKVVIPPGYRALLYPPGPQIGLAIFVPDSSVAHKWDLAETQGASLPETDGGPSIEMRRYLSSRLGLPPTGGSLTLHIDFQQDFWGDPRTASANVGWIASRRWLKPISLETYLHGGQPRKGLTGAAMPRPETTVHDVEHQAIDLEEVLPYLQADASAGLRSLAWELLNDSHTAPACESSPANDGNGEINRTMCMAAQEDLRVALTDLVIVKRWETEHHPINGQVDLEYPQTHLDVEWKRDVHSNDDWLVIQAPRSGRPLVLFGHHPDHGSTPLVWDSGGWKAQQVEARNRIQVVRMEKNELKISVRSSLPGARIELPVYLPDTGLGREQTCTEVNQSVGRIELLCYGDAGWRIEIQDATWEFHSYLDSSEVSEDPNREMPPGHFLPVHSAQIVISFDQETSLIFTALEE